MSEETILVSGASGYIAQHIVQKLLTKGYTVVGTVRSSEKGDRLQKLFQSDKFSYEIVEAIEKKGAFDEALKKHPEISIFLHTASPFRFDVKSVEQELLIPAVEGTRNALWAAKEFGSHIRKVVITSSFAAMMTMESSYDKNFKVDETSWNPVSWDQAKENPYNGYIASKKFAEREAWDFIEREKPPFSLSVVNPVYVFGPQQFDEDVKSTLNTSAEIVNLILHLKTVESLPKEHFYFVDVRDVADAHLVAFENPKAENKRLLLMSGKFDTKSILDILYKEFPKFAKTLPSPESIESCIDDVCLLNNDKTRDILGFNLKNLEETIFDSVEQILSAQKD